MKTFKTLALAAAVSAGFVMMNANANAVPQRLNGLLGVSSAAYFDISLTTESQAKIWGFVDIVLKRESDGTVNDYPLEKFCVFSNNTNGSNEFTLEILSENGEGANGKPFQLIDQTGTNSLAIPYTIKVIDVKGEELEGNSTIGSDGSVDKLLNAGILSEQPDPLANNVCDAGQMSLTVSVPGNVPATAGSYSDVITMTVTPE